MYDLPGRRAVGDFQSATLLVLCIFIECIGWYVMHVDVQELCT